MLVEFAVAVAVGFAVVPAVAVDPFVTVAVIAERFVAGSSPGYSAWFAKRLWFFVANRFAVLAVEPALAEVIAVGPFVVGSAITVVPAAFEDVGGVGVVAGYAGLGLMRDGFPRSIAVGYPAIIAVVVVMNVAVAPKSR